jgi:hypothetical protein
MPWLLGDLRLPFKFDFDQFEDDFPEIKNQRFFGFKQLSLANNHEDAAAHARYGGLRTASRSRPAFAAHRALRRSCSTTARGRCV